ncbi:TPA: flagellar basal body L-ring protein FlgH [Candidatus Poribacteria bacterium]|nr:flagellar basal body L-ring protein FlgH [Candidatus Poribacteria bacterium]
MAKNFITCTFLSIIVFSACLIVINDANAAQGLTVYDVSMVADRKARRLGDVLTVLVLERASAKREAKTETSRTSDYKGRLGGFVGIPTKGLGDGISLGSDNSFTGTGSTSRSETFDATVPVIVMEVMKNGNLVVEGQRNIQVNNEKQTIYVKGIVRPVDITAQNTIISTNLASAEIVYQGDGQVSRQQKPGFLSRLLDWIWIF